MNNLHCKISQNIHCTTVKILCCMQVYYNVHYNAHEACTLLYTHSILLTVVVERKPYRSQNEGASFKMPSVKRC